jgi:hypothetical protein
VVENRPARPPTSRARWSPPRQWLHAALHHPALAINKSLYKNPTYDAERDLAPISVFAESRTWSRQRGGERESCSRRRARSRDDELLLGRLGRRSIAGELFNRAPVRRSCIPYKAPRHRSPP